MKNRKGFAYTNLTLIIAIVITAIVAVFLIRKFVTDKEEIIIQQEIMVERNINTDMITA